MAKEDRSFFIAMGFFRPHTPFVATQKWFEMYPPEEVTLPHVPSDDLAEVPAIAPMIKPQNYGLSESDLKDCVRAYWASVSCLDAQVGDLLAALERLGLAENTIVVFFSDHGFMLGEHGQWQKQMLFEESIRVPLILAGPGVSGRGASPRTVELLDVYPTLVKLCGLPNPRHKLEGKSLMPLLDDPNAPRQRAAYSQVTRRDGRGGSAKQVMGHSVRTERWRYTEWDGGRLGVELYDHDADSHEHTNLAHDAAHADAIEEMKHLLQQARK